MHLADLGFNTKTGYHSKQLTATESRFLGILWVSHVGAKNALPADHFAAMYQFNVERQRVKEFLRRQTVTLMGRYDLAAAKRELRHLQNHILKDHDQIAVLSKAGTGGGYYMAETEAEVDAFYSQFRQRGLTGLVKASRGKQAALVDLVAQLSFEFEELVDKTLSAGPVRPAVIEAPAPVEVVDAFLERMTREPEKFADGLRKIGRKYGGVLLPKEQITAMQQKAAELQEMVTRLTA